MEPAIGAKLLDILIENALRLLRAGFGLDRAESTFFDVVRLLREHNALKNVFLTKVRATLALTEPGRLDPGMVPMELIELVAHELRWRELAELASLRIEQKFHGDASLAIGDVAHRIFEAFKDEWPDREFYQHYKC